MKRGRLRPALCAGLTSLVLASGAHAAGDAAPDPETAKYTLMKLKADTAKSEADAAKSQLDLVPDSGNSGKTTVQDGAGKGEAAILSAKAIDKAAAQIAGKFNTGSGHVLIIAGTTRPQIMDWLVYDQQRQRVAAALTRAISDYDTKLGGIVPRPSSDFAFIPALPGILGAVGAATKLITLFATDYEIGGIEVPKDDYMLAVAVAQHRGTVKVQIADQVLAVATANTVLTEIKSLDQDAEKAANDLRRVQGLKKPSDDALDVADELTTALNAYAQLVKSLTGTMVTIPTPPEPADPPAGGAAKPKAGAKAAGGGHAAAAAAAAASPAGGGAGKPATTDSPKPETADTGGGDSPSLATIIQERMLYEAMTAGQVLYVKIQDASGGYYTKKNLGVSLLGHVPCYVSGDAVVSYQLVDGKTSDMAEAGVITVPTAYIKLNRVADQVGDVAVAAPKDQ